MEDENKLVTEKIEKGTYFSEAMSWYCTRYTFVQTQFSQLLIVALFCFAAFITTLIGYFSFLPIVDEKLYVIYHSIGPDYRTRITELMEPGQDADHAVSEYLLHEYVRSREEYVMDRSEKDFNYVSKLSGQGVLAEYLNSISPDNPSSPYIVYANRGRRDVIVQGVRFFDAKGKVIHYSVPKGTAVVYFTAVENFGAQSQKYTDYIANIEFDYKKIGIDQKTDQLTHKPEMVITSYTTKLNSGTKK